MLINYLYHLTHINNIETILEYGLLSRKKAISESIFFENIADPEVLKHGDQKMIFDKELFDFVRLYFQPRNPMLLKRKEVQDEILILAIDKKVLSEKDTVFSDGNASSGSTKFYKGLDNLNKLDWKIINAEFWINFDNGKRKACAEALIYSNIPISLIRGIICNNENTQKKIIKLVNNKLKVIVNKKYYF